MCLHVLYYIFVCIVLCEPHHYFQDNIHVCVTNLFSKFRIFKGHQICKLGLHLYFATSYSSYFIVSVQSVIICFSLYYFMYMCARLKLSYQSRLELSVGNEVLRVVDDRRLVSAVPLRDRAVCTIYLFSRVHHVHCMCITVYCDRYMYVYI